jgi:hypothetical protein
LAYTLFPVSKQFIYLSSGPEARRENEVKKEQEGHNPGQPSEFYRYHKDHCPPTFDLTMVHASLHL